ncbi:uncharacterized protein [Temnothorax nylanderi]|uniref:uncharacterized protein isoform X2 n=1 Tax=Temnothorax nylanderi TaxID=102681 RepID=UPI003A852B52
MAENVHKFEKAVPCCSAVERRDVISVSAERRNLISAANTVFGEGKWNYTVVSQTLTSDVRNNATINAGAKYLAGCVSSVKVQLENGNFYEDVGYFTAEDFTRGLSIYNARIGSTVNALKRVLLSFGDKVERELQQLRRQISFEQDNTFGTTEPNLAVDFPDSISAANKVFGEGKWNYTVVRQTLNFDDDLNFGPLRVYRTGCVSFVKIQLENGNFHEDVGYYNAEEFTKGLSIQNARIGSAVNALKRVLLSFGDKVERELQQLRRQISAEQGNYIQRDVVQSLGEQISEKSSALVNMFATAKPMDLAADFRDLISVANKVFGEGKWNHTVISQTLDFKDTNYPTLNAPYRTGCVSFVKVQLENGNFHEDVGYYNAEESIKSLSIQNARIGSAINALFRVLLSFGDKVQRELKQLRRQIGSEQGNNVQRDVIQSLGKQISEKSSALVNMFATAKPMDLAADFRDLISVANKVFGEGKWNHTVVSQTLDFKDTYYHTLNAPYRTGCVSFVKVQLENGNFHEDVGYFNAKESTRSLSIHNARIGSAVNALKRVLLSFGDKVERELQQLRRHINSEQEPMDLATNFLDLISAANKVFGEGKWNHTVVSQTLDFKDTNYPTLNAPYRTGCVSFVKVQLESGNFHEDVGYFNAEALTEGLSLQNARIGSAVNALKRVLQSFGDKVERELQQLRRQIGSEQVNTFAAAEPMDLAINFHDLISVANKVFGEGKWNHTVVHQLLDFDDVDFDDVIDLEINARNKYCAGCVSYVKIQLEDGNFHEDVGYFNAKESTRSLSIHNARIGSAINALFRVLLSFGDKVERELQQLRRHISSEQVNTVATTEPMDLVAGFPDLISAANRVFGEGKWSHTVVKQILDVDVEVDSDDEDFDDIIHDEINARNKYVAGCVSYVKVQLKNENFHVDVGYCITKEPTRGLAILNAKIGSAVNALKRILMSFGEQFERELQQLQRQISPEQTDDVQRDVA